MRRESEAEILGIDLDALMAESPLHPSQLREKDKWERASAAYWETRRLIDPPKETREPVKPVSKKPTHRVPKVRKGHKLEHYEFTDRQLEIARAVLNARHNV